MTGLNQTIQEHYAKPDLGTRILAALEQSGKDIDRLTPEEPVAGAGCELAGPRARRMTEA
jgi:hypothetical protein